MRAKKFIAGKVKFINCVMQLNKINDKDYFPNS